MSRSNLMIGGAGGPPETTVTRQICRDPYSGAVRALVQTVSEATVTVDGQVVGSIVDGLLVLVGVTHTDSVDTASELARKTWELRILDDEKSASDVSAPLLVVSQFTLYGDARKGR